MLSRRSVVCLGRPTEEEQQLIKGHIMRFMLDRLFAFIALCVLYGVHPEWMYVTNIGRFLMQTFSQLYTTC